MTRSLFWVAALLGSAACSESQDSTSDEPDSCQLALSKLEDECLLVLDERAGEALFCGEREHCAAVCVEGATCEEINTALQGIPNAFLACLTVCAG